ncbi:MAG: hypothetical protein Q9190_002512 [Brigantiaea leucoxantha]
MFRNRKNAQKPSNELYALFKQSFPHVGPGTVKLSLPATTQSITSTSGPLSDPIMDHRDELLFGSGSNALEFPLGRALIFRLFEPVTDVPHLVTDILEMYMTTNMESRLRRGQMTNGD